jgi:hypothetical protein
VSDLPAELCGGPKDGEVVMIQPGQDGLPMSPIRVAQAQPLSIVDPKAIEPTEVAFTYWVYYRGAISEDSHRWLYRLGGWWPT